MGSKEKLYEIKLSCTKYELDGAAAMRKGLRPWYVVKSEETNDINIWHEIQRECQRQIDRIQNGRSSD